jgi:hypothetical protein
MKSSTGTGKRDERKDMAPVRGLAVFSGIILFFTMNALPQDCSSFSEPQSFLREASALIPQIDKDQRSSAADNIAGQQTRIGDLEGALTTAQRSGSPGAQVEENFGLRDLGYAATATLSSSWPMGIAAPQKSRGEPRRTVQLLQPVRYARAPDMN